MKVATEPPMDLFISNPMPLHRLAWHSSDKTVSLSLDQHHPG